MEKLLWYASLAAMHVPEAIRTRFVDALQMRQAIRSGVA
jgi:hypothetical protein